MAQSRLQFINNVKVAMVDNSRYSLIAGEPMPSYMINEMNDSMERLANPIYSMVESFLFDPIQLELSYQVKTISTDPIPGYLISKIDDITIKYDPITYKLYVAGGPIATNLIVGG